MTGGEIDMLFVFVLFTVHRETCNLSFHYSCALQRELQRQMSQVLCVLKHLKTQSLHICVDANVVGLWPYNTS